VVLIIRQQQQQHGEIKCRHKREIRNNDKNLNELKMLLVEKFFLETKNEH
jgi:hypothetical protein